MDSQKPEILVNPDPLPLEQTDPDLAEHFRLIANGVHPTVWRLIITKSEFTIFKRAGGVGSVIIRRIGKSLGRNDPCECGSGKKFKKCCGK